jgi:hypothetical protein
MSQQTTMIVPRESNVIDFARIATAQGLHLLTDGKKTILSPIRLPGWFRIGVRIKKPAKAAA